MSDYKIIMNKKGLKAIKDTRAGTICSQWFNDIYPSGLIDNFHKYYIAKNNSDKYAIFSIYNNKKP